jgi:hypothetical protein
MGGILDCLVRDSKPPKGGIEDYDDSYGMEAAGKGCYRVGIAVESAGVAHIGPELLVSGL